MLIPERLEPSVLPHDVASMQDYRVIRCCAQQGSFEKVEPSGNIVIVMVLPDHYAGDAQIALIGRFVGRVQIPVAGFVEKETEAFGWRDEIHG